MFQTALTVTFLCEAVKVLTAGGKERSAALRGSVGAAIADMAALGIGGSELGVEGVVRELQSALSEEMVLALRILKEEEDKAATAAAAAEVTFLSKLHAFLPWSRGFGLFS